MKKFIEIHEPNDNQPNPYDRWVRMPNKPGEKLQGMARASLYNLINEGLIRSANIKQPGKLTGCRLIWEQSLVDYINRFAEGGDTATSHETQAV